MKPRIFDHFLGNEPEDPRFSKAAHALRLTAWWTTPPRRTEPEPVAGEIDVEYLTKKRLLKLKARAAGNKGWKRNQP